MGELGALLAHRRAPTRALTGFAAGLVLYGVTLFWMGQFNAIGAFLVMMLEASFLALAALVTPAGRWRALGWPAAILLSNALRTVVPFGGLPMGGIDLGQAGGPLAPAARLGGALVLSAVVAAAGLVVEAAVRLASRRSALRWWVPVGVLAATVAAGVPIAGAAAPGGRPVGTLRAAAVQGGGRRGLRAVNNPPILVYRAQLAADGLVRGPVDLVVWPENVIALDGPLAGSPVVDQVGADARRFGATLIAGITEPVGDVQFKNAAVAWGPDGAVIGRYDKAHRVPFGEYVPGRSFIQHLVNLDVIPRDAIPGRGPGILHTPAGPVGVMISFEVYFSSRARAAVLAGAEVLTVPTNTASYTTSQVPDSEIATARRRAWETGRDIVMATPTGFSAMVDSRGRVRSRSGLGTRAVLEGTVERRVGRTPYVRMGDGPFVAFAGLALVLAWGLTWGLAWRASRPRRRPADPHRNEPAEA